MLFQSLLCCIIFYCGLFAHYVFLLAEDTSAPEAEPVPESEPKSASSEAEATTEHIPVTPKTFDLGPVSFEIQLETDSTEEPSTTPFVTEAFTTQARTGGGATAESLTDPGDKYSAAAFSSLKIGSAVARKGGGRL